jgi:hypothetical protein
MRPDVNRRPDPAILRSLVLVALLWGFLLNGFFLYVPFTAKIGEPSESALATAIGWLSLCAVAIVVGRSYYGFLDTRHLRWITALLVVGLVVTGVLLDTVSRGPWGWIVLSVPLSIMLSFLISRIVGAGESQSLATVSAYLGATPLIGLLIVSAAFSLAFVQDLYPVLAGASVVIAAVDLLAGPTPAHSSAEDMGGVKILPASLLSYGFLLGFGVALVNTNVYARIAEVTGGDSDATAGVSSQLIFLASLVGIAASLSTGLRVFQSISRLTLAKLAAAIVSLGVIVLLFADGIASIGIAGVLVGIGFGLTNGIELRLVDAASLGSRQRIELFGGFLAATTLPYVAAGVLGIQLAAPGWGTTPILVVALLTSLLGFASIRTK